MSARSCRVLLTAIFVACIPEIGTSAKPTDCTARNAEKTTVPEIAAHPDQFQHLCVAIQGVMQRSFIYESVDGVYLRPPDILNPASSGFLLGLDNIKRHFDDRYRHVSIVGRVQDCEEVHEWVESQAEEGEIVMVNGYCHSRNGPYLWVQDLRFRSGAPFIRQMGYRSRRDYGDLQPAPVDWAHRALVEAHVNGFLLALRSSDREGLASIHFRNGGLNWHDDGTELQNFLLSDRHSPFASIRTEHDPPQQVILIYKPFPDSDEEAEADPHDAADYSATVCFCREKDCTGRWPIASFDADNLPTRPYACTEFGSFVVDRRPVPLFMTRIGKGGLEEPRAR
jgi:hypothetical protein